MREVRMSDAYNSSLHYCNNRRPNCNLKLEISTAHKSEGNQLIHKHLTKTKWIGRGPKSRESCGKPWWKVFRVETSMKIGEDGE